MLNVFLTEQQQSSLPKSEESFFLEVCKAHQIICEKNQLGDYVLLPPLYGKNIVLYSINQVDNNEDNALRRVADILTSQGALVLYTSPGSMRDDIMKILGIQIIVGFSPVQQRDGKEKLRFFYSLKKEKESLKVIASIVKQLAQDNILHYKIANFFDFLGSIKHYKLFLADIPTLLIQLDEINSQESEYLEKALVNGLLGFYEKKSHNEQIQWVKELVEDLQKKDLPCIVEGEEKQQEEVHSPVMVPEYPSCGEEKMEVLKEEESLGEDIQIDIPLLQVKDNSNTAKKANMSVKSEKKRGRTTKTPVSYPPSDGPVFQFAMPTENNYFPGYPRQQPEASIKTTRAVANSDYYKIPPKPWELTPEQSSYPKETLNLWQNSNTCTVNTGTLNALEELKNLAELMKK